MKRISCLFVLLVLFCAAAPFAYAYTMDDRALAFEQFRVCAFQAEYGDARNHTVRWEEPLHVCLSGDYTDADIAFFYRFAAYLTENIPGIPEIRITSAFYDSNLQIHFAPLDDMGAYVADYVEDSWGYFTFWYEDYRITNAEIAIASDVTTQSERCSIIAEELVGALGLANDHEIDINSILYSYQNETCTLTEADQLMLAFLYNPEIPSGLTWDELKPMLENLY